jgi:hypothetical protein
LVDKIFYSDKLGNLAKNKKGGCPMILFAKVKIYGELHNVVKEKIEKAIMDVFGTGTEYGMIPTINNTIFIYLHFNTRFESTAKDLVLVEVEIQRLSYKSALKRTAEEIREKLLPLFENWNVVVECADYGGTKATTNF